ncbi:D-alanyl-lipoteichoic acid biosynthesis protein DltD [Enterococcus sp. SMC-9]|uniref:D-alanyl-lipoteichoic acid biosynthesis protein DltD n=1 Tax=Enterococcus sp. SMC-9 TaxID=2862343 RepID=UPI001E4BF26C|nr:D-alanyl-lipoteichoic acid biosynthesis protein DltD [Enterococcus sp. SMC-9]MCD1023778.1 D-alanyl-lipoteichoic acid biosynthesis protein DltD [Enterococcus sp. SMC-9]
MKKKLLAIFGPVIAAVVLLALFFFSPFKINDEDKGLWEKASSSMSGNILRGNSIKNEAVKSGEYVPFFGSSELSRISPFHPSVLAKKYNRNYTPFLLGAPGTQSLTQYMMMQSFGSDLKDKKVVFILSPQWFVKGGIKRAYFDAYFSELQTYTWAIKLDKVSETDKYLAKRLLAYGKVNHDETLKLLLREIAKGKVPTTKQVDVAKFHINMLNREDELFSEIGLLSKNSQIEQQAKKLPAAYNEQKLDEQAKEIGQKATTNNSFGIENNFYTHRIKPRLAKFNDSQVKWDYRYSKEFSDFQLVLDQLAKENTQALFIIPPINGKWSEYTGLSQNMLQEFSKKITYQLRSQGFNQIADFTNKDQEPYFMTDTIHLGWRGWLAADQYIQPFLEEKTAQPSYHLNNYFYSQDWQNQNPETIK